MRLSDREPMALYNCARSGRHPGLLMVVSRRWFWWIGAFAVAMLIALLSLHAGRRPASATHLCGITGSPNDPPCPHFSPPDGTLLQGGSASTYVMLDGSRIPIAGLEASSDCGYAVGNVNTIPDAMLHSIPDGLILTGQWCS